jgi:hypothetical protein
MFSLAGRFTHYDILVYRLLAVLLLLAWYWPLGGNRFFAAIERWGNRVAAHRSASVACVGLAVVLLRLALLPINAIPLPTILDEFSYLLAGDTYAHLRLANPPHALPIFFEAAHVNMLPFYMSKYPPAQGAALAIGEWLGHPWFGVLLSVAAMCAAITWMLQGWMPARWALLGGLLAAARFIFGYGYAMNYWLESYWGGAVTAFAGALALGALPRVMRRQRARDGILLALGIAILANSRPYEGLVFCLPLAAALAWWLFQRGRPPGATARWRALAPVAAVLVLTGAFMAYNNWRVTGNALLFPYVVNDRTYVSTPHFAWQKLQPPLPLSNPQMDAIFNGWCRNVWRRERFSFTPNGIQWGLVHKLEALQQFYLPVGLLLPVVLAWRRLLNNRKALFLFAVCASTVLGLIPVVWFQRHYAAAMTAAAAGLTVMGLRYLRTWRPKGRPVGIGLTRALVFGNLLLVPMSLMLAWTGNSLQNPAPRWASERARIAAELQTMPGPQLVLVHYAPGHNSAQEWVYNRADIDGAKIVWAEEIPGQDLRPLLDYFRSRKIWRVEADAQPAKLEAFTMGQSP